MKSIVFALLLTTVLHPAVLRSEDARDPLSGAFFPPELIAQAREQIGFTEEQQSALRDQMQKLQARAEELKQKLEQENTALAKVAKQDKVDEAALLAQVDKVLDAERELKRLHISALVGIKNLLTPEQQTKLRAYAKDHGSKVGDETRARMQQKMQRLQAAMRKWAESQKDPSPLARAVQEELKPLLDVGKVQEAEAVLDRLLQQAEGDQK